MVAILKWMFVLVLLIAVIGGGTAYWLYLQSDEGLRQMVLLQLKTVSPTTRFEVAKAQWDIIGRVRIYGLTIFLPDDDEERPSIEVPEVIATLEPRPMTDLENVVIRSLRIINPKVRAVRLPDGEWNLQQLKFQSTGATLPDVEVVHGLIQAEIQLSDRSPRRLKFQNFNVTATPKDARRLWIQVATLLEPAGPLALDIDLNLDGPKWECVTAEPWQIPVDSGLIQLLADLSPQIETSLENAHEWVEKLKAKQKAALLPVSPQAFPETEPEAEPEPSNRRRAPDFGISGLCDLTFCIGQNKPLESPTFRVQAAIHHAQIENDLLPFPFHEIEGNVLIDNRQIIVSDFQASSGTAQLSFDGDIIPSKPATAALKLRGVELNEALKQRLPEQFRDIVNKLGLTGICDIDATAVLDGGVWKHDLDLRLSRGTVTEKRFPVTVRNIEGELQCRNNVVTFNGIGRYAGQPVIATGTIRNPGPGHEAEITVTSKNLPMDDEAIAACPPTVRRTIESLKLTGRQDITLKLTKKGGVGQKYKPELTSRVSGGSINFQGFPYLITQLNGTVKWDGDDVEFTNLTGIHNGANLSGNGRYSRQPGAGRLDLKIAVRDAVFDRSLKAALPVTLRKVWDDFQPQGNFDLLTTVSWVPGEPCKVIIPNVKVRQGEVNINCFRWPMYNLSGEFSFNKEPGKLEILRFQAEHDETRIAGAGVGWFPDGKPWELKFSQLSIEHLIPNATFRNALPLGIKKILDVLRPTGDYSFSGPVEFYQPPHECDSIGAAWNVTTELSNCALNAGTRIDEISGIVQLKGAWDGTQADLDGELDLRSLSIFRQEHGKAYRIIDVRGPFAYHDHEFVAGTKKAIPRDNVPPDPTERIRGKAIGGTFYLDAAIDFQDQEPSYKAFIELEKALLEQYAIQYLQGQNNLAGVMNGWIYLHGTGSDPEDGMEGEGRLRIAPAALGELPLFVQMFQLPQLRVPDRVAFAQADLRYTVSGKQFNFQSIELLGDAISLRGRGFVRFDGGLNLEFGSLPGRGPRRLIQNLFMGAEWVAIKVNGHVGKPNVKYVPFPEVDEAWRQFLGAFNPRMPAPSGPVAPAIVPRTGQNSGAGNR